MKKTVLPILLSTLWISVSEFVRNTFLVHSYWTKHYQNMGLIFPETSVNGAVWGIWSMCFALVIFIISKKFTLVQTALLAYFIGFGLMWLVIGNLGVLPIEILPLAIPLSLLESFVASYIVVKLSGKE